MADLRRLTSFSHGAGCGCKLGPADLETVLGTLSLPGLDPNVLVAVDTGDDAAVVRLSDDQALVATLDFFTPIVDDPYDWGRIAATNALSDVYAMGARPFLTLNIVAWPVDDLPLEMLGQVLQGGIDVASKAGAAGLGGFVPRIGHRVSLLVADGHCAVIDTVTNSVGTGSAFANARWCGCDTSETRVCVMRTDSDSVSVIDTNDQFAPHDYHPPSTALRMCIDVPPAGACRSRPST